MATARGEIIFTLGGVEHRMKPTWAAIVEMEDRFKTSLLKIAQRMSAQDFSSKDIVICIWCGLRGAGNDKITVEEVGELVVAEGITSMMVPLAKFIGEACTGGRALPKVEPEAEAVPSP